MLPAESGDLELGSKSAHNEGQLSAERMRLAVHMNQLERNNPTVETKEVNQEEQEAAASEQQTKTGWLGGWTMSGMPSRSTIFGAKASEKPPSFTGAFDTEVDQFTDLEYDSDTDPDDEYEDALVRTLSSGGVKPKRRRASLLDSGMQMARDLQQKGGDLMSQGMHIVEDNAAKNFGAPYAANAAISGLEKGLGLKVKPEDRREMRDALTQILVNVWKVMHSDEKEGEIAPDDSADSK
jgi:hypothetical protein